MNGEGSGKRVERAKMGGNGQDLTGRRLAVQQQLSSFQHWLLSLKPGARGRHARLSAAERKSNLLA